MRHSIQLGCGFRFVFRGEHGEQADLRAALSAWAGERAQPGAAMAAALTELAASAKTAPLVVRQAVRYCTAYRREELLRLAAEEEARRAALDELQQEAARHARAERQRRLIEPVALPPTVAPAKAAAPAKRVALVQAPPAPQPARPVPVAPTVKLAAPAPAKAATPPLGPFATPEMAALKAALVATEQARRQQEQRLERTRAYGARIQRHRRAA